MVIRWWARWRAMQRARRAGVALGLTLCVVVTALAGAHLLTRLPPAGWTEQGAVPDGPATAFENAVLTQLSAMRPAEQDRPYRSAPWRVSLSEEDVNAWLASRLPRWLKSRDDAFSWPRDLSPVRAGFRGGLVQLGASVRRDGETLVITADATPRIDADGGLWLEVQTVRLGRLPLPASWVLGDGESGGYLPPDALADPQVRRALEVARGVRALMEQAALPVDAGRRVRLLELIARDGRLEVTARTESRE